MTLPIRPPSYMSKARAIRAKYEEGFTIKAVAVHFGMSVDRTMVLLREAGGSTRPRPQNGFCGRGPIEVIELEHEPISFAELGRRLGISPDTVKRYAQQGRIPSHIVGDRRFIYEVEIAALDLETIRATKPQAEDEPKCACCGILLSAGPHKFDVCNLCRKWCRYDHEKGEWVQRRIVRAMAAG